MEKHLLVAFKFAPPPPPENNKKVKIPKSRTKFFSRKSKIITCFLVQAEEFSDSTYLNLSKMCTHDLIQEFMFFAHFQGIVN